MSNEVAYDDTNEPVDHARAKPFAKKVKELEELTSAMADHIVMLESDIDLLHERTDKALMDMAGIKEQLFSRGVQALEKKLDHVHKILFRHVGGNE